MIQLRPMALFITYGVMGTIITSCGGQQVTPSAGLPVPQSLRPTTLVKAGQTYRPAKKIGRLDFFGAAEATAISGANDLALGSDGNLWYASEITSSLDGATISKFSATGEVTYSLPKDCQYVYCRAPDATSVVNGPDGRIWFGTNDGVIGAMDTNGNVQYFNGPGDCGPEQAKLDPCQTNVGAITGQFIWFWLETGFLENPRYYVGNIDSNSGLTNEYALGAPSQGYGQNYSQIVVGSDRNLWFGFGNKVGRVTTSGAVQLFSAWKGSQTVDTIVSGPDGDLWFSGEFSKEPIERMNTSGKVLTKKIVADGGMLDLLVGPDQHVWATDGGALHRMNSPKSYTTISVPPSVGHCFIGALAIGANGNLWFDNYGGGNICNDGIGTFIPKK